MDVGSSLVGYAETPATGNPGKRTLYHPPVASQPLAALDSSPGYPRLNAPFSQGPSAARVVVGFVGVQLVRPAAWPTTLALYRWDRVDEVFERFGVMHVSARERYGKRHAPRVGDDVPLRSGSTSI